MNLSFNPRAREGRDGDVEIYSEADVSFNPRAREGRDTPRDAAARAS